MKVRKSTGESSSCYKGKKMLTNRHSCEYDTFSENMLKYNSSLEMIVEAEIETLKANGMSVLVFLTHMNKIVRM